MRKILGLLLLLSCVVGINAQELNILPSVSPAGGTHDDKVVVTCTFPEGCAGGKYWFNGGEINALNYTEPIVIERSTRLSVAGVNAEGRIITDAVSYDFTINKVTGPFLTASPEENTSRESFYVTQLIWNNATTTAIDVADFKEGGKRYGEKVVWLVYEPTHNVVAQSDYNGLWQGGSNSYKAYLYNNYRPTAEGAYTLHIAKGVFVVDGQRYNEEIVLKYAVGSEELLSPVFTPASGTYSDNVTVSITYPKNAFYKFYQIDGQSRKNYDGPFSVSESCTIKAWGRSEDFSEETGTSSATYTITHPSEPVDELSRPVFSRSGNTVSITTKETDAIVKYWFDDRMQTAKIYNGPFTVDHNCLISAVVYRKNGISPVVNYTISHFEEEPTDFGTIVLRTPEEWENVYLTGMSPNGRFASGYTDTDGTPMGFIWDIISGKGEFISTQYYSRATGVSNDGTICGWRVEIDPNTGEAISTSDETLFYGYYRNGKWTRQPIGMTVVGISADNVLYGSYNGKPATYNIATQKITTYTGGNGSINCMSSNGSILAGQLVIDGRRQPAYWTGDAAPVIVSTERECGIVSISGNGQWMLMDNKAWGAYCDIAGYRYDVANAKLETIASMGAQYPSRYEWMYTIADDGTLYGVYDRTLISPESGKALTYTTDGVWRSLADVLAAKDFAPDGLELLSCKLVSPDQNTFIVTAFPSDLSSDEGFVFALALRFNAAVKHAAPTNVKAEQMFGIKTVKLSWEAPLMGGEDVVSYKILRNGTPLTVLNANTLVWYDHSVENQGEYTYSVVAAYRDGVESEPSFPYTLKVEVTGHAPARNLSVRQSGINDINLTWQSPIISLPKLQYFREDDEFAAFGTAGYDSEWAIRIPASDLAIYDGLNIRTFQFLPTGPQAGYELRLYKGTPGTRKYNATPFYTQTIDPATLKYGTVNTILLDKAQPLPNFGDLIIALYIKQKGNDNMLGISHDGFKAGFTDLCRVMGVHDQLVSIAEASSVTTEIVVSVGVGLGTEESLNASMLTGYEVSDNGVALGNVDAIHYRIMDVEDGKHNFAVRAQYKDGEYSAPTAVTINVKKNEDAFVPVSDLKVGINKQGEAEFTWMAPMNDDKKLIHWGDLNPTKGLTYEDYPVFSIGSIYPVTLTNAYAGEYEITHLFFYPTAEADFRLFLDDNIDEIFYDETIYDAKPNQLNYIELPQPITIDESTNYRFVIDIDNCMTGEAPIAFDSSNASANGYSNMLNCGNDWMTLNEVLQIDEHPNWLMGLLIRQKDARPMPLQGYNVLVDGECKNSQLLKDCKFATANLTAGLHTATVDIVYDAERTIKSEPVNFEFKATGIEAIDNDHTADVVYDLQGRRIISDKLGRGLFIINNKKIIK